MQSIGVKLWAPQTLIVQIPECSAGYFGASTGTETLFLNVLLARGKRILWKFQLEGCKCAIEIRFACVQYEVIHCVVLSVAPYSVLWQNGSI